MRRRIFIAINLPENLKKRLREYQEKWIHLDPKFIRWTRSSNLHITLSFLGYLSDDETYEICEIVKKAVKKHEPFNLIFQRIVLGPPNKKPRMFWLAGIENKEFSDLQKSLNEAIAGIHVKTSLVRPHITLARFNSGLLEFLPELVSEEFKTQFSVDSIQIMQSNLKRSGAEYSVLESIEL
ncbi:RNA 2',3'-cyclic phosphodiesterase [Patescibacteria group bacterium]|nr:RNA 2',3'-cyclic phosphodiesterase [Patescibacteria group bacterium]MBU3923146.1 RNA 2',3'-cyclic phosphodiesterase [Patescibacteria group bacterium]